MSDQPIIPRAEDIVGRGVDKLATTIPTVVKHVNDGNVWSHVFTGLVAQAGLVLRRLSALASSKRLPLATGPELLDLCSSEFDTNLDPTPTKAVGEVTLFRAPLGAQGVIRAGTIFTRAANLVGTPIRTTSAQYESLEDVFVASGATSVPRVKIRALQPGSSANQLWYGQATGLSIQSPLFDKFVCDSFDSVFRCSGGSDGVPDSAARTAAKAYASGQYAPVNAALVAGAYFAGARHVAVSDNSTTGVATLVVGDVSWASSFAWCDTIYRYLQDNEFVGAGCALTVLPSLNVLIHAAPTVVLRDSNFLTDTTDITVAIQKALRSYFDDRADWFTFKLSAIQSVISRAHPKILTCTAVSITQYANNTPVAEPSGILNPASPLHYYLADNSTAITYASPT